MTSRRSRCPSRCTRSARAPRRCASRLWPSAGAPPERTDRRAARRDEHLTKEFTMPTGSSAPRATTPMSDMGSGTLRSPGRPRHGANCARRSDGCASADAGWGDSVPVSKRSRSQSGRSTPSTRCTPSSATQVRTLWRAVIAHTRLTAAPRWAIWSPLRPVLSRRYPRSPRRSLRRVA